MPVYNDVLKCINCGSDRFVEGHLRAITNYQLTSTFSVVGNAYDISTFFDCHELMSMKAKVCQDCGMVMFANKLNDTEKKDFYLIGGKTLDKNSILLIFNKEVNVCSNKGFTISTLSNTISAYISPKNPNGIVLTLEKDILPNDILILEYDGSGGISSKDNVELKAFYGFVILNKIEKTYIYVDKAFCTIDGLKLYAYTDSDIIFHHLSEKQKECFKLKDKYGIHEFADINICKENNKMYYNMMEFKIKKENKLKNDSEAYLIYVVPNDNKEEILGPFNSILFNSNVLINTNNVPSDKDKNVILGIHRTFDNKIDIKVSLSTKILDKDFKILLSEDDYIYKEHEYLINYNETDVCKDGTIITIGQNSPLKYNKSYSLKLYNKNYENNKYIKESKPIYFVTNAKNIVNIDCLNKQLNPKTGLYDVTLKWNNISDSSMATLVMNKSNSNSWIDVKTFIDLHCNVYKVENLEKGYTYQFMLKITGGKHDGKSSVLSLFISEGHNTCDIPFDFKAETKEVNNDQYKVKLRFNPPNQVIKNISRFYIFYDTKPIDDPKVLIRAGFLNQAIIQKDNFTITEYIDDISRDKNTSVYYFIFAVDKSGNEYYSQVLQVVDNSFARKSKILEFKANSNDLQSVYVTYNVGNVENIIYIYLYLKKSDTNTWDNALKVRLNPKSKEKKYTFDNLVVNTEYDLKLEVKWSNDIIASADAKAVVGHNGELKSKTINIDSRIATYQELLKLRNNIGENIISFNNKRDNSGEGYFEGYYKEYMIYNNKRWNYHDIQNTSTSDKSYIPQCIAAKSNELKSYKPIDLYADFGDWVSIYKWYKENNKLGSQLQTIIEYKDDEGYSGNLSVTWHQSIYTFDDVPKNEHVFNKDKTIANIHKEGCIWNYLLCTNYWWEAHGTVMK